jgi:single-strand DNA-binding protein
MSKVWVQVDGNIGQIRQLRFTPSGDAVVDVSIAATPRVKSGQEWVDSPTMWFTATFWKWDAENLVESADVGQPITVGGWLTLEEWTSKDGKPGTTNKVRVETWGIRRKQEKRQQVQSPMQQAGGADDPWSNTPTDEPPF